MASFDGCRCRDSVGETHSLESPAYFMANFVGGHLGILHVNPAVADLFGPTSNFVGFFG